MRGMCGPAIGHCLLTDLKSGPHIAQKVFPPSPPPRTICIMLQGGSLRVSELRNACPCCPATPCMHACVQAQRSAEGRKAVRAHICNSRQ